MAEGQTIFNSRQDQTLFHGIANRRKLFQVDDSFSARSGKLRPCRRRRVFDVPQKANEHLITLRLLLQFDNVTVRTAQFSQLANAAKDKKRGTDGGADRVDPDLHHRSAWPPLNFFQYNVHLRAAEFLRVSFKKLTMRIRKSDDQNSDQSHEYSDPRDSLIHRHLSEQLIPTCLAKFP